MTAKEKKKQNKKGSFGKILFGFIIFCLLVYGGASVFFHSHFYYGTTINGFECQFQTVEEVEAQMAEYIGNYSLTLKERENKEEVITASQINFHYEDNGKIGEWKKEQKGYQWILAFFEKYDYKDRESFVYEEEKLDNVIDELQCFDKKSVVKPVSAYPSYEEEKKQYVLVPEVEGTTVKKTELKKQVKACMESGEETLELEAAGCYKKPKWYQDDQEIKDALKLMNQYVSSEITYDMEYKTEKLDADQIHQWISMDDDCKVTLDSDGISSYVSNLASKYNTVGKRRSFKTASGKNISVSGGTYGWRINQSAEVSELTELIKNGKTEKKKPVYSQTGRSRDASGNDIGDTYIAISIGAQHMWFYKNGRCIKHTPIVTGDASKGMNTPRGVYSIAWKQRDKILRGDDYETPVSYWLPFITSRGIGIHDADWRSEFGKDIYKTNGSHGCVNTPRAAVSYIYENVTTGTPVVVY